MSSLEVGAADITGRTVTISLPLSILDARISLDIHINQRIPYGFPSYRAIWIARIRFRDREYSSETRFSPFSISRITHYQRSL